MYKNRSILVIIPCFNESLKIGNVIKKQPRDIVDEILVIDDGSTDDTAKLAASCGAKVVSLRKRSGVGYSIREGLSYALQGKYSIAVILAGNDKDNPQEIPHLLDPICNEGYDFVQGSRFLRGGCYGGDFPLYRKIGTRFHAFLFSIVTGKGITESSNGFRAFRTEILKDSRINLNQNWLDHYELEPYLYYNVIRLGYKTKEVPVSKIYPPREIGFTKMRPVIDWWSIIKPLIYLKLGLRK